MNTIALLFGTGICGGSLFMFRKAWQELINKRRAATLKMTPIRHLKPGLVLTSGKVQCEAPIQTPYTQTEAAWYRYSASQRHQRRNQSGFYEESLASGQQTCPFLLKDRTGVVAVDGNGGTVVRYPHYRVLKSQSGKKTPLRERIKTLKAMDRKNYPEGRKKPFFRKIEAADAPLDIPDDLVELTPGSAEVKNALRTYREQWIAPDDTVYVLGTAAKDAQGAGVKIAKGDKHSPFFVSHDAADLSTGSFQRTMMVELLVGAGMAVLGIFLLLIGTGVMPATADAVVRYYHFQLWTPIMNP